MLTIYHVPRTRSLRVVWLCEEMGVPYEVKTEVFGQPSPEFLEANPLGAFPGIRDGDVLMGESTAIMQYVTEKYGPTKLALKPDHPRFADYLQFVTFGEASMAAYMNPVIATGKLRIEIGQRFKLADARKAHEALQGRETIGASVLLP